MNRETIDTLSERAILVLVVAVLVFAPLAFGAVRPGAFLVVQGLTICVGIVWLLRIWLGGGARLLFPPICWSVLAFASYAVIRYFTAEIEFVARTELIRITVYAVLFFAVLNNTNRSEYIQILAFTLIAVALVASGYAVYQFATHSLKVWDVTKPLQYSSRAGGPFINPNHLAGFLELALPIAFAYVIMGRFNHLTKIFIGYSCFVMLGGIAVTLSRGGWLATSVAMFGFCLFLLRYREFRAKAAITLAVLVALASVFAANTNWSKRRIDQAFQSGEFDDARLQFWQAGLKMWKDHIWIGVGPGHFDFHYGLYRQPIWRDQLRPIYAHNDYLNTLADWGLLGLALIVISFGLLAMGFAKTWPYVHKTAQLSAKKTSRGSRVSFLYGAAFGLTALLIHEFFDFNLQIPAIAMVVVTLMALITVHRKFETDAFGVQAKLWLKMAVSVFLVCAIAFLAGQGLARAREVLWVERSVKVIPPTEKIAALKKAFEAEPGNFETTYKIGELLRAQSWEGNDDYRQLAEEAMLWFERGVRLNPCDAFNYLRIGMCLDWIGKHEEAAPYYEKALHIDPNNHYLVGFMGWHFVQIESYVEAKKYFERSLAIYDNYLNRNSMPAAYLEIVNRKLAESTNNPTIQ